MHENFRIWPYVRKKIFIIIFYYARKKIVWQKTHFSM